MESGKTFDNSCPVSTSVVPTEGPMPYTPPNQTAYPFKPVPENRMTIDEDGNVGPEIIKGSLDLEIMILELELVMIYFHQRDQRLQTH